MKKHTTVLLATIFILLSFDGCKKSSDTSDDNCNKIQEVRITGAKANYYVGDTISLGVNLIPPISLFTWTRGSASNFNSHDDNIFIYPCSKDDEGWYYLNVSYPDCNDHNDSVYIKVTNIPVTPPCTPSKNTVNFSSIPNISFSSTTFEIDATFNCKKLRAFAGPGQPDFNIYFNPYWNDKDPEDGAYSISSGLTFPEGNDYSVYIASTYESIYFQSQPGTVYITHVNGKLQATFCTLTLTGDLGGTGYSTTATGNLAAP